MVNNPKNKYKKRQGVSVIVVVLSIFTLLGFAGLAIDLSVILNVRVELQKATEAAALAGASVYEAESDQANTTNVAYNTFGSFQTNLLKNATITKLEFHAPSGSTPVNALRVSSSINTRTYFFALLGVEYVNLQARSAAVNTMYYLSTNAPTYPTIGSLINAIIDDSNIVDPLGSTRNTSKSYDKATIYYDNIIGLPDTKTLSLGAGGYITMRLPKPMIDKEGPDLYIKESGNREGYFVFAGIDNNFNSPYYNSSNPGDGIKWVNISCTGIPENGDTTGNIGAYRTSVFYQSGTIELTKFYGSGYFNLGAACTNDPQNYNANIKKATYLKIIDDNTEDGFIDPGNGTQPKGVPTLLLGDSSSATPGADIDAVGVMHHARLITSKAYDTEDINSFMTNIDSAIATASNGNFGNIIKIFTH